MQQGKHAEALEEVNAALAFNAEDYMILLHRTLKGELEFALGRYDESKRTISEVLHEFEKEPDIWKTGKCREAYERANWYWNELQSKAT